jgi:repressor LexA
MEKKGVIKRYEGAVRGIEILDKQAAERTTSEAAIDLPVLGFIAAGQPIEPFTDPNAIFGVPPSMVNHKKRCFVLRVKGDSMIEAGIYDKDYVVVEQTESANNGEVVVALLDNGFATLKRFFKEATRVRLEPANSTMSPIFVTGDKVRIQGKVVGVIRKYGIAN